MYNFSIGVMLESFKLPTDVALKKAKEVIGVELNKAAVKDAITNAKINGINNNRFFEKYMLQ